MMEFTLFPDLISTLLATLSGVLFGFLLRKGAVSRFDTIVGQLTLRDFTVMKVILTAIVVGSTGIYALDTIGMIPSFHLSKTSLLFGALGGAVFGVGMSLAGYCPGTAVAALGEGTKDVIFVVLGLLFGAWLFNVGSSVLLPLFERKDFAFQQTLPQLFSVQPMTVIAGLWVILLLFALGLRSVEKKA